MPTPVLFGVKMTINTVSAEQNQVSPERVEQLREVIRAAHEARASEIADIPDTVELQFQYTPGGLEGTINWGFPKGMIQSTRGRPGHDDLTPKRSLTKPFPKLVIVPHTVERFVTDMLNTLVREWSVYSKTLARQAKGSTKEV